MAYGAENTAIGGRIAIAGAACILLGAAAVYGPLGLPRIEKNVLAEANARLEGVGADWAKLAVRGRTVTISGVAPDKTALAAATLRLAEGGGAIMRLNVVATVEPEEKPIVTEFPSLAPQLDAMASSPPVPAAPASEQTEPQTPSLTPTELARNCQTEIDHVVSDRLVTFARDSTSINASASSTLDEIAGKLRECGAVSVILEGHTDAFGSPAVNQRISELRARAAADYLEHQDIGTVILRAAGAGETAPLSVIQTGADARLNRRVDFIVDALPANSDIAAQHGETE
ncbi:MAG: OmpA family protein [Parvularculaceae bacterium]